MPLPIDSYGDIKPNDSDRQVLHDQHYTYACISVDEFNSLAIDSTVHRGTYTYIYGERYHDYYDSNKLRAKHVFKEYSVDVHGTVDMKE